MNRLNDKHIFIDSIDHGLDEDFNHETLDQLFDLLRREEVSTGAFSIIKELAMDMQSKGLNRKAPDLSNLDSLRGNGVNVIPSSEKGHCCEELIVSCYNKDNLSERLREMLYCTGITCREINKKVIFMTSKWDNEIFDKHFRAVEVLRREGVRFYFILISNRGVNKIPV